MKFLTSLALVVPLTLGTMALSHAEETNPIIKARMEAMKTIGGNTKVLGDMAKGETPFDAEKAQAAAATISQTAAEVPALFEAEETSATSEALPAIWQNYAGFSEKADALRVAAENAASQITSPETLGPALGAIGGTCKACHKDYRAQK
ncbi:MULTISPECIES: c-type cytochrome [unclassified Meridianimarinicoccus]|uniref:c-type cytochrome n=1 Tax=unclassified Meridianimarinicoccus TaxID=2923344 RepID=UPI001868F537|nr:cytochrome c [Fluviibacterium sp. MJW13]